MSSTPSACRHFRKISAPLSIVLLFPWSLALVFLDPRHHAAQVRSDVLHLQLLFGFAKGIELLAAGFVLIDPLTGELAALDLRQDLLHGGASFIGDHARAAGEVAIFGGIRDGIA